MIKKSNTRVIITLSKKQAEWLKKTSKKLNMSVSKLIKWLIDKNITRILNETIKGQELEELIKIAKTPWIRFNEDDE